MGWSSSTSTKQSLTRWKNDQFSIRIVYSKSYFFFLLFLSEPPHKKENLDEKWKKIGLKVKLDWEMERTYGITSKNFKLIEN
jgi:hypothetical protein